MLPRWWCVTSLLLTSRVEESPDLNQAVLAVETHENQMLASQWLLLRYSRADACKQISSIRVESSRMCVCVKLSLCQKARPRACHLRTGSWKTALRLLLHNQRCAACAAGKRAPAASMTPLPAVGVPIPLPHLDGLDSLHSIVQLPRGIPVATAAIGKRYQHRPVGGAHAGNVRPAPAGGHAGVPRYQARLEAEVTAKAQRLEALGWEAYAAELAAAAGKRGDARLHLCGPRAIWCKRPTFKSEVVSWRTLAA
jgi:hypothetical protein